MSTPVKSWFLPFTGRHIDRHPRGDWPSPADNPEFFGGWLAAFIRNGLVEDVADAASLRLMDAPPEFLGQHVESLIRAAGAILRERAAGGPIPGSREEAEKLSRGCPECAGCGQTWRRFASEERQPRLIRISLGCLCPIGRWLTRLRREGADDALKGIPSLADHPDLRDPELSHPSWPAPPRDYRPLAAIRTGRGEVVNLGLHLPGPTPLPAAPSPPAPASGAAAASDAWPLPGPDVVEVDGRLVKILPDGRTMERVVPGRDDGPAF